MLFDIVFVFFSCILLSCRRENTQKKYETKIETNKRKIVVVVFDDQIIELMLKLELTSSWYS